MDAFENVHNTYDLTKLIRSVKHSVVDYAESSRLCYGRYGYSYARECGYCRAISLCVFIHKKYPINSPSCR